MPRLLLALALLGAPLSPSSPSGPAALAAPTAPTAPAAPAAPSAPGASSAPAASSAPPAPTAPAGPRAPAAAAPAGASAKAVAPAPSSPQAGPEGDRRTVDSTATGYTSDPLSIPPSLTATALRDEIRQGGQRRQDELAALEKERARLEKLAADIAAARSALGEESSKFDERLKKAETAKLGQGSRSRADAAHGDSKSLAKTLKGMKTELAASLLCRLERPLAVEILRSMRPADAGAVLEKMKPEAAAEMFALMAEAPPPGGAR